jgi:hypothetical protein
MQNKVGWSQWLPGLLALREYQAPWLVHDMVAGLVLAAKLEPNSAQRILKGL